MTLRGQGWGNHWEETYGIQLHGQNVRQSEDKVPSRPKEALAVPTNFPYFFYQQGNILFWTDISQKNPLSWGREKS